MLLDEIRQKIRQSVLNASSAKDVLRVVLGEVQALEGRQGKISDEQVAGIIRKIIASNEETIKMATPPGTDTGNLAMALKLAEENRVLNTLLPSLWNQEEILAFFAKTGNTEHQKIIDAKSDGQATGIAMKALKGANAPVSGNDVTIVVKEMRTKN